MMYIFLNGYTLITIELLELDKNGQKIKIFFKLRENPSFYRGL